MKYESKLDNIESWTTLKTDKSKIEYWIKSKIQARQNGQNGQKLKKNERIGN